MADWDVDSRLEEIRRAQRKAGKGRIILGLVLLVGGLALAIIVIFWSGAFAGPLGVIVGLALVAIAAIGAIMMVTGYLDFKHGRGQSIGPDGIEGEGQGPGREVPANDASMSVQIDEGMTGTPTLQGKEIRWLRGDLKDVWTLVEGGREIAKINSKGTWPFSYDVKGLFNGTAFQMILIKKPDKRFEVRIGQDGKEWAKIWNASITHLSPAVVKTWDGRVFEIRGAGKTGKGLAFAVVGKGEKIVATITYHEPRTGEMGEFIATGLASDDEVLTFALICVVFAALFGPLEGGNNG